jgi:hypothetical protein
MTRGSRRRMTKSPREDDRESRRRMMESTGGGWQRVQEGDDKESRSG